MDLRVVEAQLDAILPFRERYLEEMNTYVRYHACHERGWSDSYLLTVDGRALGYGSVKGLKELNGRDTVFEFYIEPTGRAQATEMFQSFLSVSKARFIEGQSNDPFLAPRLEECAEGIRSETILFKDEAATDLGVSGAEVRLKRKEDFIFKHELEPEGGFVVELGGEVVGTGGYFLHYNKPFADLYMEVRKDHRRKGIGSYLLQEVKKECYRQGRIPAARCQTENEASKACLIKAGLAISGYLLVGKVKNPS